MKRRVAALGTWIVGALLACGSSTTGGNPNGATSEVAAVIQSTGSFGGLAVSTKGEMLAPLVTRDSSGNAAHIRGVVWIDATGASAALFLDVVTGLPTRA